MYPRLGPRLRRCGTPAGLVTTVTTVSAAAHLAAAVLSPAGVMAWWMVAMAAICIAGAVPSLAGRLCAGRTAGHLLAMNAAMILIHLVLVTSPATGNHHGHTAPVGVSELHGHDEAMLALIAVELLCLMGASTALRLSRTQAAGGATPAQVATEYQLPITPRVLSGAESRII